MVSCPQASSVEDGERPMRILRKPEAAKLLGLAPSSLDDIRRRDPSFPAMVQLGLRSCGVIEAELLAWIASRPRVSLAREKIGPDRADGAEHPQAPATRRGRKKLRGGIAEEPACSIE
jgi:predicted DNA-binding transcriptional regulator AlpA